MNIWYEKYTPKFVEDVILPENIKQRIIKSIKDQKIPNLGFWSHQPGLGKSCTSKAIIRSAEADALFINASLEKGIDVVRNKIMQFASSVGLGDCPKIVVMDECLEENEEVLLIKDGKETPVKLKDLNPEEVYECISLNLETGKFERDTCSVISDKPDDIYEVLLEDGRTIKVTANHPFIVMDKETGKFISKSINDGLSKTDVVVSKSCYNLPALTSVVSAKFIKTGRVINLNVKKNHTFITKNGIVTHNCDYLSPDAQASLRGFLDDFSGNCSFIFTGNFKSKIIEPLLDRLENYDFAEFPKTEMVKPIFEKLKSIVIAEGFEFSQEKQQLVLNIIKNCYPKIRNMIKTLQKAISTNSLDIAGSESSYEEILNTLKTKDYPKLIEQVNSLTNPDGMFEFLYSRVSEFSKLPNAVQSLAKGQFQSSMVRDKNLNLASTLCELTMCV